MVSSGHVWRVYKKALGASLQEYLTGKRIQLGRQLLRAGKSVTETALACHYSDT